MITIDFYSENFDGVSGRKLQKFLEKIKMFREDFWKELRGDTRELSNFVKEDTVGFYTVNDYGYLLGKYESMVLPLPYKDPYIKNTAGETIDFMLIAEVYTVPKYRRNLIATTMIRDAQYYARMKDLPILLGCQKELVKYYQRFEFVEVESYPSATCSFMYWSFSPDNILQRFNLLFSEN